MRMSAPPTLAIVSRKPYRTSRPTSALMGIFFEMAEQSLGISHKAHQQPGQGDEEGNKEGSEPGHRPKAGILNRRQNLQQADQNANHEEHRQQWQRHPER